MMSMTGVLWSVGVAPNFARASDAAVTAADATTDSSMAEWLFFLWTSF